MNALNRCLITDNPCGTDAQQAGGACSCEPCQHYLRVQDAKKRLGSAIVDDIAKTVMRRKMRGWAEVDAISRLLTCKKEGHSRNPEGKCVRCYDTAEEPGYEST